MPATTTFFRPAPRYLGLLALVAACNYWACCIAQAPSFGPAVVVGTCQSGSRSEVTGTTLDAFGYAYVTGTFAGTVSFGTFILSSSPSHRPGCVCG